MCRVNCYLRASGGLDPAPTKNTTAGENDRIDFPIVLDDGHFQVSVEWGGFDLQPYHSTKHGLTRDAED
jgi:hypothetical protein